MLSGTSSEAASGEPARVERRVLEIIAETCGFERGELSLATPLPEALDSLTLVAVVARIEAVFDLMLAGDEPSDLLAAPDVGALARLIARKVDQARANLHEDERNASC
jgi:acyl carrier protein